MTATYRSIASSSNATISKPSGTQTGDLMIASLVGNGENGDPGAASLAGWTQIASVVSSVDDGYWANWYGRLTALYRIAQAGDGASFTFTGANKGAILSYQAGTFDATTPIGVSSSAASIGVGAITTTGNDNLIVFMAGAKDSEAAGTLAGSWIPPTGYTERYDVVWDSVNGMAVDEVVQSVGGSTGAISSQGYPTGNWVGYQAIAFEVNPAAAVPDTITKITGVPWVATPTGNERDENAYRRIVLEDTPAGYWRLEESSGTHEDAGLMNKTMTWTTGTPTYHQPGKFGYGVTLNSTQIATAPVGADFAYSTGSVEAWVKAVSPGTGFRGILTKQGAYGVFLNAGVASAWNWGAANEQSSGINCADGNWHHLVYTFQPGSAALYVDGVKTSFAAHSITGQSVKLTIGCGMDSTLSQAITGSIDECAVYHYRLTDVQVLKHYRLGKGMFDWTASAGSPSYDKATGIWTLDDTEGIVSPKMLVATYANWTAAVDLYMDTQSPYVPFQPDGGFLWQSNYYKQDKVTAAYNSAPNPGPYQNNGNAQAVTLNAWTRKQWSYLAGAEVYWMTITITNDASFTGGVELVRKFELTPYN